MKQKFTPFKTRWKYSMLVLMAFLLLGASKAKAEDLPYFGKTFPATASTEYYFKTITDGILKVEMQLKDLYQFNLNSLIYKVIDNVPENVEYIDTDCPIGFETGTWATYKLDANSIYYFISPKNSDYDFIITYDGEAITGTGNGGGTDPGTDPNPGPGTDPSSPYELIVPNENVELENAIYWYKAPEDGWLKIVYSQPAGENNLYTNEDIEHYPPVEMEPGYNQQMDTNIWPVVKDQIYYFNAIHLVQREHGQVITVTTSFEPKSDPVEPPVDPDDPEVDYILPVPETNKALEEAIYKYTPDEDGYLKIVFGMSPKVNNLYSDAAATKGKEIPMVEGYDISGTEYKWEVEAGETYYFDARSLVQTVEGGSGSGGVQIGNYDIEYYTYQILSYPKSGYFLIESSTPFDMKGANALFYTYLLSSYGADTALSATLCNGNPEGTGNSPGYGNYDQYSNVTKVVYQIEANIEYCIFNLIQDSSYNYTVTFYEDLPSLDGEGVSGDGGTQTIIIPVTTSFEPKVVYKEMELEKEYLVSDSETVKLYFTAEKSGKLRVYQYGPDGSLSLDFNGKHLYENENHQIGSGMDFSWMLYDSNEHSLELAYDVIKGYTYYFDSSRLNSSDKMIKAKFEFEPKNIKVSEISSSSWSKNEINFDSYITSYWDDFNIEITVAPEFDTKEWKDEYITVTPEDISLLDWEWDQIRSILSLGYERIDGLYVKPSVSEITTNLLTSPEMTFAPINISSFDIQFGCSGKYKITITCDDPDVEIINGEQIFDIYPTLNNQYSYTNSAGSFINNDRLSINWCPISDNIIKYPVDESVIVKGDENPFSLDNALLLIPGLYLFDNIYYAIDADKASINARATSEVPSVYTAANGRYLDLSALSNDTNTHQISLIVSKNGAMTPVEANNQSATTFTFQRDNDTTGIDEIVEVEGNGVVEYYDLNGMKVNPDNLVKGIYIKVENGKASKVIR